MPARANGTSAAAPVKRFELPVLEFKFGSLTDGTDIPPPLPSPVPEEVLTPPKTPTSDANKAAATAPVATNGKTNGDLITASPAESNATNTTTGGTKRPAEDHPSSPTLSERPGSIRRLFSRNMLNNAYASGEQPGVAQHEVESPRPASRTNGSVAESKKTKRMSGWFSRLRSSESTGNKRASMMVFPTAAVTEEEKKPAGPPPPMIPELNELKSKVDVSDEGSLGGDLFKNIK